MKDDHEDQEKPNANPGYAVGELIRALLSKGETATKRVQQWQQVLVGMATGKLQIGSRLPVAGAPAWITLEVIHGGFATGNFAAGGELKRHEIDKISELQKQGLAPEVNESRNNKKADRTALNIYFAGADGRQEMKDMLNDGCFRTSVPEEAALLVSTWLLEKGETDRAIDLLDVIGPFFDRLPFYPEPSIKALRVPSGDIIYLQPASYCEKQLRDKKQQLSVKKMNESIKVWTPLYDRAVSLFLETVEGPVPELLKDEHTGKLVRAKNGQPIASGGWPCRQYPNDWAARASALLQEYEHNRQVHLLCQKHKKPKENFARLKKFLTIASQNPAELSPRDAGTIRKILASYVTAHGAPGSEHLQLTRAIQEDIANFPLHTTLSKLLADRLANEAPDDGVPELERLLVPLSTAEADKIGATAGKAFPESIVRKIRPCGEMPLTAFVEQRLLPSSESLATALPMLTARIKTAGISDPCLTQVIASAYRAFRKRRSLLLFNLERQIRFEELPWISAVQSWVGSDKDSQAAARSVLTEVTRLAIASFPQTIVPNKLIKELRTLAKDAGIAVPLVDELAADIFMGSFSANFLSAAHGAAQLLKGSLYQRYYGINYDQILALNDVEQKGKTPVSPGFAYICTKMAESQTDQKNSVAYNGAIIEQGQIITTHNLASLWCALNMGDLLRSKLPELARSCYTWICRRQQLNLSDWRAELSSIKNCAYAWRQMIFYVSLCTEDEQKQFLFWAEEHFNQQTDEFRQRFAPAMNGLVAIMGGEQFDASGHHASGGQRFIGWSTKPHFLRRQATVQ